MFTWSHTFAPNGYVTSFSMYAVQMFGLCWLPWLLIPFPFLGCTLRVKNRVRKWQGEAHSRHSLLTISDMQTRLPLHGCVLNPLARFTLTSLLPGVVVSLLSLLDSRRASRKTTCKREREREVWKTTFDIERFEGQPHLAHTHMHTVCSLFM